MSGVGSVGGPSNINPTHRTEGNYGSTPGQLPPFSNCTGLYVLLNMLNSGGTGGNYNNLPSGMAPTLLTNALFNSLKQLQSDYQAATGDNAQDVKELGLSLFGGSPPLLTSSDMASASSLLARLQEPSPTNSSDQIFQIVSSKVLENNSPFAPQGGFEYAGSPNSVYQNFTSEEKAGFPGYPVFGNEQSFLPTGVYQNGSENATPPGASVSPDVPGLNGYNFNNGFPSLISPNGACPYTIWASTFIRNLSHMSDIQGTPQGFSTATWRFYNILTELQSQAPNQFNGLPAMFFLLLNASPTPDDSGPPLQELCFNCIKTPPDPNASAEISNAMGFMSANEDYNTGYYLHKMFISGGSGIYQQPTYTELPHKYNVYDWGPNY